MATPHLAHELFASLVDLPPAERDARLCAACGDDAVLLEHVRGLFVADAQYADATARRVLPSEIDALIASFAPGALTGLRLGAYALLDEVGSGGMGRVYRAERVDGHIALKVAIKFLRRELIDAATRARFDVERLVLARLNHPNIARLYDASDTPDGTPYYVMEYVDGVPVTTYCERLGVDRRVELMRLVCAAVVHAHHNLVVHRDLKPTNILVTADGTPKLLDFGIAKPLSETAHSATCTGSRYLSPYYAAPEQLTGAPIGVACDVYALGLLLYEVLCGARPFQLEGLSAGQIERLICEIPPEAPSERGHVSGAPTPRIRELDAIVLRCLRKEPAERYASVEELDADLANYLEDRPVQARGGHGFYRARKFVGRHRLAFSIALAALVALGAAVGAIVEQNRALQVERDHVVAERDRAELMARSLMRSIQPASAAFMTIDAGADESACTAARQIAASAACAPAGTPPRR